MSAQDKMERILKEVHLLISNGESVPGNMDQVIINRQQMFSTLEKLNLAVYEIMDQYEVTTQSRELAHRRSEKKSEEFLQKISSQAEDVYAASLIYTNDALNQVQSLIEDAVSRSQEIWRKTFLELENEKRHVREDQAELREQLQDFKDSNKYLVMLEDCNREREKQEKKNGNVPEKKIQNEARHYSMRGTPEIKVNPAYFQRRSMEAAEEVPAATKIRETPPETSAEEYAEISMVEGAKPVPVEVRVDLDSEYFKWKAQEESTGDEDAGDEERPEKKEWKGLWGKR